MGTGGDLPLLNNESWSNVDACNYGVGPSLTIIMGRKEPLFPFLPPTLIKTLQKNAARIDFGRRDRPAYYWIGTQEGQFPFGRPFCHHSLIGILKFKRFSSSVYKKVASNESRHSIKKKEHQEACGRLLV